MLGAAFAYMKNHLRSGSVDLDFFVGSDRHKYWRN